MNVYLYFSTKTFVIMCRIQSWILSQCHRDHAEIIWMLQVTFECWKKKILVLSMILIRHCCCEVTVTKSTTWLVKPLWLHFRTDTTCKTMSNAAVWILKNVFKKRSLLIEENSMILHNKTAYHFTVTCQLCSGLSPHYHTLSHLWI